MDFIGHLATVTKHRQLVREYCFRAGLYKQGLTHDLSKFSPEEFLTGARYYRGDCSPNSVERSYKGYSAAWLRHKGRNKHHAEYWLDYGHGEDKSITGIEMPVQYVVEMFCDRIAACRTYDEKHYTDMAPLLYYIKEKGILPVHKNTRRLLEKLLYLLSERGEEYTFAYIRKKVLK